MSDFKVGDRVKVIGRGMFCDKEGIVAEIIEPAVDAFSPFNYYVKFGLPSPLNNSFAFSPHELERLGPVAEDKVGSKLSKEDRELTLELLEGLRIKLAGDIVNALTKSDREAMVAMTDRYFDILGLMERLKS